MSGTEESPATPMAPWREKLHAIIFEADTPPGKAFDVFLLVAIVVSVVTVSLETVETFDNPEHHEVFKTVEWCLTILFTIEYGMRLLCVRRPLRYAFSFFGIVDFLAIVPTYLTLLVKTDVQSLAVIRSLRLLRAFRVFKLARMLREAAALRRAIWDSRGKIVVFLATVLIVVTIAGPAMYLVENFNIEGEKHFKSIPHAMYWAIVTMTTVGYGDVVPQTPLGQLLSAVLIMVGYSLIIVPTGFVSAELVGLRQQKQHAVSTQACPHCMAEGHDLDARYCKHCGNEL